MNDVYFFSPNWALGRASVSLINRIPFRRSYRTGDIPKNIHRRELRRTTEESSFIFFYDRRLSSLSTRLVYFILVRSFYYLIISVRNRLTFSVLAALF